MEHSYSGLTELISQDAQARAYFMSLPDYVQGMIQQQQRQRAHRRHPAPLRREPAGGQNK